MTGIGLRKIVPRVDAEPRYSLGEMNRRWLAILGFFGLIGATGLWVAGAWHAHTSSAPTSTQPATCKLPVFATGAEVAGFLTVPGYSFSAAPGSVLSGGSRASDGRWAYDLALRKWLPVDGRLVSADGRWWMYQVPMSPSLSAASSIHLVDQHGVDRTVWSGRGLTVALGWTGSGAVFMNLARTGATVEMWLVDPSSRHLRALPAPTGEFAGLQGSGLWSMREQVISARTGKTEILHWTLSRTELNSGATATWWDYEAPGTVQLIGFDGHGRPVLYEYPAGTVTGRVMLLTAPKAESVIANDTYTEQFDPISELGDGDTAWFGDGRGQVWRWTQADGLHLVTQVPNVPDANAIVIAGPCH